MNAVLSRPEKPNPCKTALRASSVPRRITWVTRTSLRQRSAFLHLAVDQAHCHLPLTYFPTLDPLSKMSCQSIKVQIQAITGEDGEAVGRQELSQGVDEQVRRMLCSGTQMQHRQN